MKTTTDNHIDKLLHEAMKQRAAKVPPLADDFAEKVLQRTPLLTSPEGKERKRRVIWPYAASAVASCIVLLLVFHYNNKVVPELQSVVAEVEEQPAPEAPKASDYSEYSENSESSEKSEPSEPIKPKRTYKVRKAIEEPQLAEAELIQEEAEAEQDYLPKEPNPYLLAAAETQDIRSRGERLYQEVAQLINNH